MENHKVDAVRSALDAMGFKNVEIVVAETGWPYKGDSDEVGASIENAKAYNGNLIAHLRSMVGTPLMPGKSVDTYLFALYDENLKPGPTSERSFGLYQSADLTMTYDVGLSKSSSQAQTPASPATEKTPATPSVVAPSPEPKKASWCVPKKDDTPLPAESQSFIGVNYGQHADNLPSPAATAKLLQSTSIQKVRLYGSDAAMIKALANTGIGIVIGTANGDIPALASDPNFAKSWVDTNVVAYYPASKIILINVGNEVIMSGDNNLISQLLPAMQNVKNALDAASLGDKVKVSTVHSMTLLKQSEPPSSGSFDPAYGDMLKGVLAFNNATSELQASLDYACAHGIDCSPIQPGGSCFEPNTLSAHAAYAMNLYYQSSGPDPSSCDFSQAAMLSSSNPSYNGCTFPGGST
ncbi:hypothetical protein GOBAR_DD17544 [Gossypium barbadense]|nr:hypothetical protein GOBAR_DD17544 [Gossypium barbadense]